MARPLLLSENRLLPRDPIAGGVARALYDAVKGLPIISPHGHTDPAWFADNDPFSNATDLLLGPDHYLYRMLYSQGIDMAALRVPGRAGEPTADAREAWRIFANHFYLFRGTPSHLWLKHVFKAVFGFEDALEAETSDVYFDRITEALQTDAFRPRALFERFNIELIATTESPSDDLVHHRKLAASGWKGRVVTAYRPDPVVDPEHEQFRDALVQFAILSGIDIGTWQGYLAAHRKRRADFMAMGATSTDHGHPTAATADLSPTDAEALFNEVMAGPVSPEKAELFRAQMLTEMAAMSLDDGLVMQIHPGSYRNHNPSIFRTYGRDKGADIPTRTDYVRALKPLLDRFGNEKGLTIILFTLDETAYARELAPLAGHYPALRLGPPWWFHDSTEGMKRFRSQAMETAGIYNTVGFNDDTRAFLSIPARHDVARRVDCAWLAELVADGRMDEDDAHEVALDLAYRLPKKAYKL